MAASTGRPVDHELAGVELHPGDRLLLSYLSANRDELLARVESLELDGEPEYTQATFVGGPRRLPIRYRAG